jgi:hypothetical protein
MTLRPHTAVTVPAAPADLEHFQHYVAALAARLPAIVDAHVADRQMLLHLLDEQIAYPHARRRHLYAVEGQDGLHVQQWCEVSFHLEALQKTTVRPNSARRLRSSRPSL